MLEKGVGEDSSGESYAVIPKVTKGEALGARSPHTRPSASVQSLESPVQVLGAAWTPAIVPGCTVAGEPGGWLHGPSTRTQSGNISLGLFRGILPR